MAPPAEPLSLMSLVTLKMRTMRSELSTPRLDVIVRPGTSASSTMTSTSQLLLSTTKRSSRFHKHCLRQKMPREPEDLALPKPFPWFSLVFYSFSFILLGFPSAFARFSKRFPNVFLGVEGLQPKTEMRSRSSIAKAAV